MQRTTPLSRLPFVCVTAAICVVFPGMVSPAFGESTWAPTSRAESLASSITSSESAPAAVAKFAAFRRYGDYLTRERYASLADRIADEAPAPTVRFRAKRLQTGLKLDRGRVGEVGHDGMEGELADQGCLTRWNVVGPFDNPSMGHFDRRLPPEKGASGPFEGKRVEVEWRSLPPVGDRCRLRVGRAVHPAASSVAYLGTEVEVESRRRAELSIGASGGYRVWVNGEPVAEERESLGMAFDAQTWSVELRAGANEILVKLVSRPDEGLTTGIRLLADGREPLEVEHRGVVPEEVEAFAQSTEVEASGDGLLPRARSCAEETSAEAVWCARTWRRVASKLAATPWRSPANRLADAALDEGAEGGASDRLELGPVELVQLAGLMDDRYRRLALLEAAVAHEEAGPWTRMALASAYGSSPGAVDRQKRRSILESLYDERPDFWPAGLRLGSWYAERGYPARALEIVRELDVVDPHRRPVLLRRLAGLEQRAGGADRADELHRKLGGIRHRFGHWAGRRVSKLTSDNQPERALEVVRSRRRLQPLSTHWARREAELLRVLDREEEALAVLDELIAQRPGDAGLRLEKADLLVALGRRAEAKDVLAYAEKVDPQNQRVSNYLSHLTPESKLFHEPWMIEDVRSLAADRDERDREHSRETVLDQTIVHVASNGLDQRVVQRVERVNTTDGVDAARQHAVSYTRGDERVEVLDVRVHKKDGGVLEDYDSWSSGRSRKGSAYYNDLRQRVIRANNVEVGDLVEFRYRVRTVANQNFRGDYFGDLTYLQETEPVGKARYVVEHPATMELFVRRPELEHERIGGGRPGDASLPDGYDVQGVELDDVPPVETDPNQPGYADIYEYVAVSNKETWDEIGDWWWNLVDEQLIASDAIARKARSLTSGHESDRRKVSALHNYVVKNTRYLHVGLGIHGWKPYRTSDVFENKYGDCKDKAALLKVMLEEVGIETHLVLVRTRDLGHVEDVPASMHLFNHAINYIPEFDLFLDPTAEFNGTTELTPMDQGAQALVVEDGGASTWTTLPVDEADDNVMGVEMTVELAAGEASSVEGRLEATGQRAVGYRRSLQDPERRDSTFEKRLAREFSGVELRAADYSDLDALEQPVEIDFEFEGGRLERSGSSGPYLLPYGTEKELQSEHADQSERQQDLTLRVPYENRRTIRYRLSGNREFGDIPESTSLEGEFGSFSVDYRRKGPELIVETAYRIDAQRIPVEKYSEFRAFLGEVTSELNEPIPIETNGREAKNEEE